jgi:hypothetical protein
VERGLRLPALIAVVALAGCGGPIQDEELRRGIASLGALAAEGELLADGAARDRTRATFTRVQARTLAEEADHEAEKLADAQATASLAAARDEAVKLAQDVSDALAELRVRPGDETGARSAKRTLHELTGKADVLIGRL